MKVVILKMINFKFFIASIPIFVQCKFILKYFSSTILAVTIMNCLSSYAECYQKMSKNIKKIEMAPRRIRPDGGKNKFNCVSTIDESYNCNYTGLKKLNLKKKLC